MTAVPNPRFRDQLAEALWLRVNDVFASRGMFLPRHDVTHVARFLAEQAMPTIAAEVEARVSAAANQRAVEELREARRAQEAWDRRRVEDYAAVVGVELTLTPGDDLMRAVDQLYRAALAAAAQPTDGRTGEAS